MLSKNEIEYNIKEKKRKYLRTEKNRIKQNRIEKNRKTQKIIEKVELKLNIVEIQSIKLGWTFSLAPNKRIYCKPVKKQFYL